MRLRFIAIAGVAALAGLGAAAVARWSGDGGGAYQRPNEIPFPAESPYTVAKARLGETLFFDVRLSGPQTLSCASCHLPSVSWTDHLPHAQGAGRQPLALRTPTLLNVAWTELLGWDGKFHNLEEVTFAPVLSAGNMNGAESVVIARLQADPAYAAAFVAAFGSADVTRSRIEAAVATFERTLVAGEAPFDRFIAGDANAISPLARRGYSLFRNKGLCASCHAGWNFTDGSFHDIGTGGGDDVGRGRLFPSSERLKFAFKTPTLRDVELRAPYMHDGSVKTLEAVIDHYDRGGVDRPSRAEHIRPLRLTPDEKQALVAFLKSLTSDRPARPQSHAPQVAQADGGAASATAP